VNPAEIGFLHDDPTLGPLACLVIAEQLDNPLLSAEFARLGRQRVTAPALANDLQVLIGGAAPGPRATRALLTRLRNLPPADVQTLSAVLPPDAATVLGALQRFLQLHKDEPVEKHLSEMADALLAGIKTTLQTRLDLLSPVETPNTIPDMGISLPGK
jgi:hypothetical protein